MDKYFNDTLLVFKVVLLGCNTFLHFTLYNTCMPCEYTLSELLEVSSSQQLACRERRNICVLSSLISSKEQIKILYYSNLYYFFKDSLSIIIVKNLLNVLENLIMCAVVYIPFWYRLLLYFIIIYVRFFK